MRNISQFVTISEKPQSETITQSKTQRFTVFCHVKQRKAACHHNLAARLEECWATLHKKRKRQRAQGAEIKRLHKIWLKTTVISSSCFNFCLDAPQAGKTVGTVVKAEKSFLAPSQNWDTTAPYSPSNPWVQINSIQSNITQLYDTLTTLQRHRKSRPSESRGSAQCFCGLTVNVNRVRELAVGALTVRIVSAAVGKRCSRLSAACSLHAAMRVCFISRKGHGSEATQTQTGITKNCYYFSLPEWSGYRGPNVPWKVI